MDSIDVRFMEEFNRANALYADDQLDECVDLLRDIIADSACPRYHRMKCLLLLASTLVPDMRPPLSYR